MDDSSHTPFCRKMLNMKKRNATHRYPTRSKSILSCPSTEKERIKTCPSVLKKRKKDRRTRNTSIKVKSNDGERFGYTPRRPKGKVSTLSIIPNRSSTRSAIDKFLQNEACKFATDLLAFDEGDVSNAKNWYNRNIAPNMQWVKLSVPRKSNPSLDTSDFKTEAWQSFLFGVPYVHVGDTEGRGKGVFASRTFTQGKPVGIYLGFKQTTNQSEYRLKNIDLQKSNLERNLFMGMHFLNDPYFQDTDRSAPKTKYDTEHPNVIVQTDFLCVALKRIEKDEEFLFSYDW